MNSSGTPVWTPGNVLGCCLAIGAGGFAVWLQSQHALTTPTLVFCVGVIGAGAYMVDSVRMHAYLADARDVAGLIVPHLAAERGGRRETDPVVLTPDVGPVDLAPLPPPIAPGPYVDPTPTQRFAVPELPAPAPEVTPPAEPDEPTGLTDDELAAQFAPPAPAKRKAPAKGGRREFR